MDDWYLEMAMIGPIHERYTMRIKLDEFTAREVRYIQPPVPGLVRFEVAVEVLKRREFRKGLFIKEAQRLATALAERMEDAEGWHGVERQESAQRALAQ